MATKLFQDDPDKIAKTHEIQKYFDQIFAELENKPLTQTANNFPVQPPDHMGAN
ncbi:MAG TPA: hypothetical protein V6D19_24000 [Stenomitos sp.]